jgi:hypothetical protein
MSAFFFDSFNPTAAVIFRAMRSLNYFNQTEAG